MIQKLGALNIQLFAEGGAVGEGAGVGDSQNSSGEVVYGKQPDNSSDAGKNDASQMQNAEGGMQNGGEKADEVLDNFYKEHPEAKKEADKRTTKAVQSRVYQMNKAMQKNDAILSKMMVRHGVESIEELEKALDSDEAFEALAAEKGENPDTLRELERLKMIERNTAQSLRQAELERKANETFERWMQEAEPLRESYPGFDLNHELENADFRRLLQSNIPMEHAYKLIHHDELVKAAEAAAAEKLSKSVQARAARPVENGLGNQSGVVVKNDVSKLTRKDRAEIAKRVARGERIEF